MTIYGNIMSHLVLFIIKYDLYDYFLNESDVLEINAWVVYAIVHDNSYS